ncbi:uncharacterized protein [Porites lutea]|uniref:uncharacterized protein n=1 Tax=Porites lutea TaxID=51062 RepID=UPI003CC553E9
MLPCGLQRRLAGSTFNIPTSFFIFLWIFTGCSNSVSENPSNAIVTKARCYANCLTKNPASNETEIPCQTNDCKECLGPCGSSDSDEAACKQTCRASSSCLESCEFLTKVKNLSSLINGDNSSTPSPGIPSITNRSLTSIGLKWEAVQNTTGIPVYMIEMSFSESGRNFFRPVYLSEVFVVPEATISLPSLCAYVRSPPFRPVYSPVLFKFRVAVLTANSSPDNTFSGNVYSRAKRCNHHLVEVRSMIGCSASDKATLIYTYPGCQNITNFPKSECYKFDPPEAPIEDRVVHNIRPSRLTTQDDYRFQVNIAWDPPVYPYKNVTGYYVWTWQGNNFSSFHRPSQNHFLIPGVMHGKQVAYWITPRYKHHKWITGTEVLGIEKAPHGMNMNQKEKWKVTRQSSCGISQYRNIMKYKVEGQILLSWIRKKTVALLLIIAVLGDARIAEKEKEKIEKKYQDLRREITRLWNTKAYVVPVVVGALGIIPKNLKQHLETIGVTIKVEVLQKAALLVTGKLLRKVLEG